VNIENILPSYGQTMLKRSDGYP